MDNNLTRTFFYFTFLDMENRIIANQQVIHLINQMECSLNPLHLFHISFLERGLGKHLERGSPMGKKEYLDDDWMNPLSRWLQTS